MMSVPVDLYSPYTAGPHSKSDASYIEKKTVTDLYKQMKDTEVPARSLSSASHLTSLCVNISPSSSNFFEVLYVGKIKVWQNNVSAAFIDEALEKFRLHELEKRRLKQLEGIGRLQSADSIVRRGSTDSKSSSGSESSAPVLQRSVSYHSNVLQREGTPKEYEVTTPSDALSVQKEVSSQLREMKTSPNANMDDHNRTMVLQVDRTDLRLISPDRKVILLHKHSRDIISCMQGVKKPENFGFICKETANGLETSMGYIFKCESPSIVVDAVAAITQAFIHSSTCTAALTTSCEHCPMVWFHRLSNEVERASDRRAQSIILRRLEQLDPDEQMIILSKFKNADTDCLREQNEFLLTLLRAHCESKQGRHMHDTAENRSEFLNQYLGVGGANVFSKAKKSLSNSFDQFLKRRTGSNNNLLASSSRQISIPQNKEHSPSPSIPGVISETNSDKDSEGFRSRSSTIDSHQSEGTEKLSVLDEHKHHSVSPDKGLMMDIFLKVGHNSKTTSDPDKLDSGSWRQAIFKRIITHPNEEKMEEVKKKKSKEEMRILWKSAIKQTILLVRMEKQNERLKAQQVESAVKRVKLEYDEMKPNQREVMEVWEMLTNKDSHIKCDKPMLLQAIRQGVPRGKRGDVWKFLAEQHCTKSAPPDPAKYPNYNTPYDQLLRQLTSHQHAILIDLGRTFPNHSYFSSPMGPGQLGLFNLLKAYSLLDPEVGYCQGLSFVAGILLLHMEEPNAFILLRHLMFRRGMRSQYLPDMVGLQVKLYQLSRLLHDQLPELYKHLETCEVSPTLYAAPWILTLFASQFPLGFVARVFDLVFLEGADVIFRVALSLLTYHRDGILKCENFEEIMTYFKDEIANVDKPTLDKLMKMIYTTDITKQLEEYKVEYQVLQEEIASVKPQVESLRKLEAENKVLKEQNVALMRQLELSIANVQRLEKTRVLQQARLNKVEMQSRGLDVTVATLGNFINKLIEEKVDVEIPGEVRRIVSQISFSEHNESLEGKGQNNLLRMLQEKENNLMKPPEERSMTKSLSTGRISVPPSLEAMARTNSLNTKVDNILTSSLKNQAVKTPTGSTEKKSQFFSSSHNNILEQRRLHGSNSLVNIEVQNYDESKRTSEGAKEGVLEGTGSSIPSESDNHPLSNCDVHFTYSGTKELKQLRTSKLQQRNSSPDVLKNK
ncbi:TBC1 domain family member 4 isoform X1 [Euwallacea similis]|uniref:TBC1 domain family member 4 isoform X1 n=2 Tax=Euwallacea similis TaxID=1736056 RepID=UPI00344F0970